MLYKKSIAKSLQVCAIVCFIFIFLFSCNSNNQNKEHLENYSVFNPIVADSTYSQEYVAEIQSLQNIEIRARTKGFVEKIYVDEGKSVAAEQLMFSLNSNEYKQELLKAKAQLSTAQAELKQAEANIKSAIADINQVKVEVNNITVLTNKNVVSKSELEMVNAKLSAANAKKDESLAMKEAVLAKIEEANASINLANLNLGFTQIKAPFSGIINRIPNKVGALIDEGTLLTTLSNNNEIFAYFNVSENDYLKYVSQQKSKNNKIVSLKMSNGELFPHTGIIETIESEIDKNTGNLAFRAKFPNPEMLLKHGSSGKILINNLISNAILIPQKSVFEVQENQYVFVLEKDNTVRQRKIVSTQRLSNMFIVSEGLTNMDRVLFDGVQILKDGDKITPILKSLEELLNPKTAK